MIPLVEVSSNWMCPLYSEFAPYKPHLQHAKALSKNIRCSIGNLESENMCLPQLSIVYYSEAYKIPLTRILESE